MKSIKFLAALAIPAMFAACTNEDISIDTPQKLQEVVGAELIGTDISMNLSEGLGSRLHQAGSSLTWDEGDKLGLGWITYGTAATQQLETKQATNDSLFANHLFEIQATGEATTKGNVYKGWHFAYWPYEYMEQVDKKLFTINPAQDEAWTLTGKSRYADALSISAKHFLKADDLEDNQLKNEKKFKAVQVVSELMVGTTPVDGFVTDPVLNNLKFKDMTITASEDLFAFYAELNATELPDALNEKGTTIYNTSKKAEDKVYNDSATVKALKECVNNYLVAKTSKKVSGREKTVKTDVAGANLVTGEAAFLRAFVLPTTAALNAKISSIVINVENGTFTIDSKDTCKVNKAALDSLALNFKDGRMFTKPGGSKGVMVQLYPGNFKPNFKNISSYDEWKKAVVLVDALGFTNEQEFTITGDIEVDSVAIAMPATAPVKVKGNKKIITKKNMTTWPAGLDASNVDVVFDSNVTLANASLVKAKSITVNAGKKLTLKQGKVGGLNVLDETVTNNGTVVVQKFAKAENVVNHERVEVVYGSYVTVDPAAVGTVAYVLTGNDKAYEINNLIAPTNNEGIASVNTLVINSGKTLNLGLTDPAQPVYDPYTGSEGSVPATPLNDLSSIAVEMNGGSIVGVHGGKMNVGKVSVLKGTNTIIDVIPASINVAAKSTLNIDATEDGNGDKYALDMTNVDIDNDGTLNVETKTHVAILINTGKVDATGYMLHCYTTCNNTGTAIGDVKVCDCPTEPVVDEKAEAVMDAFAAYQDRLGTSKCASLDELVTKLSAFNYAQGKTESWASYLLYDALSQWLVENGYEELPTDVAKVEKWQLQVYQNTTGNTFEF